MLRVAINGYGRIGRNIVRTLFERGLHNKVQIIAINDLGDARTLAHLTCFDSTFGRFFTPVELHEKMLKIGKQEIQLFSETDVANLPWHNLNIDVVLE